MIFQVSIKPKTVKSAFQNRLFLPNITVMIAIISYARSGTYRLLKRENYGEVLRTYLHLMSSNEFKVILIYDLAAKRTVFKAPSYNEHCQRLRKRHSSIEPGFAQALEIYKALAHQQHDRMN